MCSEAWNSHSNPRYTKQLWGYRLRTLLQILENEPGILQCQSLSTRCYHQLVILRNNSYEKKPEAERNDMPSGITETAYSTFKPPTVEIQGNESLPAHYKACLRKKKELIPNRGRERCFPEQKWQAVKIPASIDHFPSIKKWELVKHYIQPFCDNQDMEFTFGPSSCVQNIVFQLTMSKTDSEENVHRQFQ